MSLEQIVTERVTTRGYELGHDATLPPSAFMRYLEHMRWRSDGLLQSRGGGEGVVRAQALELYEPLGAHVELEISAWISRVGRTSITMSHEIVRISDGALVARASATLVALDASRRPTPYPDADSIRVLERPGAEVAPPAPGRPATSFACAIELRRSDHDNQRHVNQARYGDLIEDLRWRGVEAGAFGEGDWARPARGLSLAHDSETRAGDALRGHAWADGADVCVQLERAPEDVVARARIRL